MCMCVCLHVWGCHEQNVLYDFIDPQMCTVDRSVIYKFVLQKLIRYLILGLDLM